MIVEEEKSPVKRTPPVNPLNTQGQQVDLEESKDDSVLNRVIQVRSIPKRNAPKGKVGTMYFDSTNKKLKIWIDETGGWADIPFTTSSTSTTTT